MSWYRETFQARRAISVPSTAGGTPKDINVVIPYDDDEFWDAIDATGLELRVTAADGFTLLAYSADDGAGGTFSKTNRAGRVQIDGAVLPGTATECALLWLYFDSTSTQGTGAVATTIAAALTGTIELGTPSTWVTPASTPRPGLDRPRASFGKSSTDEANLWLDVTDLLERRVVPYAGRYQYEEPRAATYSVVNTSGSAQAGMIDTTLMRWVERESGSGGRRIYLRLRVKAGTDDTRYTAAASILTSAPGESGTHRTLTARAGFRVRDVLET